MNIFNKLIAKQVSKEVTLGNPLDDALAISRRQNHFASLRGGNGFRQPKASPKTNAQGLTRGDRKRLMRLKSFFPEKYAEAMNAIRERNEQSA
nr:hypothetical protein [Brucella anthropi]